MDRATLLAHDTLWGEEASQVVQDLHRLTDPERALYDELRDNRIRPGLWSEQERIGFGWVGAALAALSRRQSGSLAARFVRAVPARRRKLQRNRRSVRHSPGCFTQVVE